MSATATSYALDNDHVAATDQHQALADLLDEQTRARIRELPGWPQARRCLDVGAGGGSIACWLADEIGGRGGSHGQVVALDLKPGHIPQRPGLVTVAHDLAGPVPVAERLGAGFDLIVSRMTLQHLRNRREVLRDLAGLLSPGGTLLVADWVTRPVEDTEVIAPSEDAEQLFRRFQRAVRAVFEGAGVDRRWARQVHRYMRADGLVDVHTTFQGGFWRGGGSGLRLIGSSAAQLAPQLQERGMSRAELDRLAELLRDPELVVEGYPLYVTSGVRAA